MSKAVRIGEAIDDVCSKEAIKLVLVSLKNQGEINRKKERKKIKQVGTPALWYTWVPSLLIG